MHSFAYFNGEFVKVEDARIPLTLDSVTYGHSVFTTIAFRDSRLLLWDRHLRRIRNSLEHLRLSFETEKIRDVVEELTDRNKTLNARIRVTILSEERGVFFGKKRSVSKGALLVTSKDVTEVKDLFDIGYSENKIYSQDLLGGLKTGNYLNQISRYHEVRTEGFDEGLVLNERDDVVSACLANLFWFKRGAIFTPDLSSGCLSGTVRSEIIKNSNVIEKTSGLEEVESADGIFLTSSAYGIRPVRKLGKRTFKSEELPAELQPIADKFSVS